MCVEMLRSSQSKRKKKNTASLALVPVVNRKNQRPQKLKTLNLLHQDHSLLTTDQWNLLSNLIHSYDEHNALTVATNFAKDFNSLHPKLRYKIDSNKIIEIATIFLQATEPFIQSNHHFASLSYHDRSIVLCGAVDNVSCLGGAFLLRQSELITNSAFCHGIEITYGTIPYNLSLNLISSLDQDVDLVKLSLSIFAFCTNSCTLFNEKNSSLMYLTDIKSFLSIQNMYAEVVWKYLLYKYSFEQSVIRFSQLVKNMITAVTLRTHLQTVRNHTDIVERIIQRIEHDQLVH
ncbi:unnamed protein product [Rotaria sp. Silwood2]|nr:unnamed protein product [Rotaria sp. Silwood2]CAF2799336.1 unnamed protein product [Rotaria sp. Silwood2]CAF3034966.1 unnamed protein product [Rotaria sp. Silwood2]CAF3287480.1 unnamed protein product [Rotaria sp. Silwood2]CAF4479469.1 unnamed protein product [Rotaria sp. Silwood2]